jgi:hypothetical protein
VLRRELVEGWERGRFDIVCLRISDYVSEGGCVRGYSRFKVEAVCCCWSKGGERVEGNASRHSRGEIEAGLGGGCVADFFPFPRNFDWCIACV